MLFDVITIFPDMLEMLGEYGVTGRAVSQGTISVHGWNPRDYTADRHRSVDDRPYGGGPGMVMSAPPLAATLAAIRAKRGDTPPLIYLSPQGMRLDNRVARRLSTIAGVILLAGRYEGVDERFLQRYVDEEYSIGDYVLSGGELACMVLIDAVTRHLPGVLGNAESAQQDSFVDGLLDCPHYTRPDRFAGIGVPDVLLKGNHAEIERWRTKQSLGRTWVRRPDLLERKSLSEEQRVLLEEFKHEYYRESKDAKHDSGT